MMNTYFKLFAISAIALISPSISIAQSLNVKVKGGAIYNFKGASSSDVSVIARNDGDTQNYYINIQGNEFKLKEVELIYVDPEVLVANNVRVVYGTNGAEVLVAGNLAKYVQGYVDGADVKIDQSLEVSDDVCGEITYTLQGTSPNGSFTMTGDYKSTFVFNGLQLTSLTTAPFTVANGKRIAVKVTEGTTNLLSDAPNGTHKGTIVCKGHLEFKQKGALQISGKTAHAIFSKEYVQLKNSAITITESVKDGINCAQYFLMESGTLNMTAVGDDGIQVDYKDAENREAEDTGSITIKNGTLNCTTTADGAKALKAENDINIQGGVINLEVRGNGLWDATKVKTKASACLGADGAINISGGQLTLNATGSGGKGMSCDGDLLISDGSMKIHTSGGMLVYSNGTLNHNYTGTTDRIATDYKSSPKGIKADGVVTINGGSIDVYTSTNGAEGIESKKTLTINGGTINIKAYDDGINSASDMTIAGGEVSVVSTAGDGLDSNANIIISGGKVCSFGGGGMEQGLDSSTETGCSVRFTGGTILAAGGGNSAPTSASTSQPFVSVSGLTLTAGSVVTVKSGETVLASITVPAYYGTTSTPLSANKVMAPSQAASFAGGNRPGGSSSSGTVISAPGMVSGQSYTVTVGTTTVTATAKLK